MSCISSSTRSSIIARITKLTAQLALLNDAFDSAASTDIEEYRFDSGEGSQRVTYRSQADIIKSIDMIESRIAALNRRLNGTGLVSHNLRRKQYNPSGGRW